MEKLTEEQINSILVVLQDYLHLPEVVEFHAAVRKRTPIRHAEMTNSKAKILLNSFLDETCKVTGFTREDILGKKRDRELADVRFAFAMLAIDLYNCTRGQIMNFLSLKHRSAISYYEREMKCPQKQEVYLKLKNLIEKRPWTQK